jgi:hypothetical protein
MNRVLAVALCALMIAAPSFAQQTTIPSTASPTTSYQINGGALQLIQATLSAQDSGTCTTARACIVLTLGPTDSTADITANGTFTGTAQIEATLGNGQWTSLACPTFSQGSAVNSFTAAGGWQCDVSGKTQIRLRISSYTSGSAVVALASGPARSASFNLSNQPISIVGPTDTPCYVKGGTGTLNDTTNHANCKASAAIFKGGRALNTSTTIACLKLYNLATDPTLSSATGFVESIPIPPASAAGGAGGWIDVLSNFSYSTGLAYGVTGMTGVTCSGTENSAPPAGVFVTLSYD